ncbi:PREDICTED: skeletal aspartic acid-rich protein 1-like [Nicotiana attenuata]|uniref:skeletal aspartic acid-rich protein 1-like n=1 Tax=Nicotiana attenuata TaxID=49451 RepID=UPI0009049460|nr:PREDICTED: skeletal aspartic acid-rich protein 1-like [Nicotiana attenuata]
MDKLQEDEPIVDHDAEDSDDTDDDSDDDHDDDADDSDDDHNDDDNSDDDDDTEDSDDDDGKEDGAHEGIAKAIGIDNTEIDQHPECLFESLEPGPTLAQRRLNSTGGLKPRPASALATTTDAPAEVAAIVEQLANIKMELAKFRVEVADFKMMMDDKIQQIMQMLEAIAKGCGVDITEKARHPVGPTAFLEPGMTLASTTDAPAEIGTINIRDPSN